MDNAPYHKAYITIAQFQENNIKLLKWPANSLDFNPIKSVWNCIKA